MPINWRNGGPEAARHTEQLHLRVPPGLIAALQALADRRGVTKSSAAAEAILRRCEELGIDMPEVDDTAADQP